MKELLKYASGVVRLSTERFWNTYVQINNTPHRIEYIENDICLYAVMSVVVILVFVETVRFRYKD